MDDTKSVSAPKQKNLGTGLKLAEHPAYDLMNYELTNQISRNLHCLWHAVNLCACHSRKLTCIVMRLRT